MAIVPMVPQVTEESSTMEIIPPALEFIAPTSIASAACSSSGSTASVTIGGAVFPSQMSEMTGLSSGEGIDIFEQINSILWS